MANKKGNPLSGAFRSPAPGDPPPWEEKPDKAAGAAPSKPGEVKPAEPPKEATDPKAAGAVPGKPGEAKPAEPPKEATDPKAAGAVPGKPGEGKPTEPPKDPNLRFVKHYGYKCRQHGLESCFALLN